MLKYVADQLGYVVINKGRVINDNVYKVTDKMKSDPDVEIFNDDHDDIIISSRSKSKEEILKILNT